MADIKKWCQPEATKKEVYEGFYPVLISMCKAFEKEAEKDDRKFQREVVAVTFKTLVDVPFPDKTSGQIIVEQQYYNDIPFHVNALNGLARAAGVPELTNTDQLEGKTVMVGFTNRTYEDKDNASHTYPQFGFGLFSYAPVTPESKIDFIANDYPDGGLNDDIYKEWFKQKVALYKSPK